ncbi:MAG TPA: hypothetical protein VEF34_20340 [Syntrophobacteraceae bacterium]|nr:hypothetical protein [Syntrophobacteraceae bacterium]
MNQNIKTFCDMIRNRTDENRRAIKYFSSPNVVLSPAFSILRQELDSMIRVIYLLAVTDLTERQRLIDSTLQGKKWKSQTSNGKWRDVTDRDMVDLAQHLQGWTQSVYKFGCSFVHLSDFHNHITQNPFDKLMDSEKQDILNHMRYYYGGPSHNVPDMSELSFYVPQIFEKISSNLECYLKDLEHNKTLDEDE